MELHDVHVFRLNEIQKLKKDYLTIASLNKEIIDRTAEMNQLRKECNQLRSEVAENRKRMTEDVQLIAESLYISPFEVHFSRGFH